MIGVVSNNFLQVGFVFKMFQHFSIRFILPFDAGVELCNNDVWMFSVLIFLLYSVTVSFRFLRFRQWSDLFPSQNNLSLITVLWSPVELFWGLMDRLCFSIAWYILFWGTLCALFLWRYWKSLVSLIKDMIWSYEDMKITKTQGFPFLVHQNW